MTKEQARAIILRAIIADIHNKSTHELIADWDFHTPDNRAALEDAHVWALSRLMEHLASVEAAQYRRDVIQLFKEGTVVQKIADANDFPDRTYEDVIQLLKEAECA